MDTVRRNIAYAQSEVLMNDISKAATGNVKAMTMVRKLVKEFTYQKTFSD